MRFVKMHGSGIDHVVVDMGNFERAVGMAAKVGAARSALVRSICDRRRGMGADGVLAVGKSAVADVSVHIFNSDGSEAQMCGNGIRCVGKYAFEHGLVGTTDMLVETASGIRGLRLLVKDGSVSSVRVDMGIPQLPGCGVEETSARRGGRPLHTRLDGEPPCCRVRR